MAKASVYRASVRAIMQFSVGDREKQVGSNVWLKFFPSIPTIVDYR